jgi:hypothetical protein
LEGFKFAIQKKEIDIASIVNNKWRRIWDTHTAYHLCSAPIGRF